MLKGTHFIGGKWITTEKTFENQPVQGKPDNFSVGNCELVNEAAMEAERAFENYSDITNSKRASFLRQIAIQINKLGDEITEMGMKETGLPKSRLEGERQRTTNQINLFASHIEKD